MAAELIIAPEAQQDVDEAYSWYEDRRPGLGEEFLDCVDAPAFSSFFECLKSMQKSTRTIAEHWCDDFRTRFSTNMSVGKRLFTASSTPLGTHRNGEVASHDMPAR
jgi:hypothetical protein